MFNTLNLSNILQTIWPSLLIGIVSVALLLSPIPEKHPGVYTGIIIDLCLLSPLLVLILSRFYKSTPFMAMPFLILGFLSSFFMIPEEHRAVLTVLRNAVLPVIEIGILALAGYKGIKYLRSRKADQSGEKDGLSTIREAIFNSGLPPVVSGFLATELSVLYYVFLAWKPSKVSGTRFSMYRESGQIPICLALLMVIGIETVVLHRMLVSNYEVLAWILSILSIYTAFYFLAHIKALWLRPTILTPEGLWFKNGLLGECRVDFESIAKVELRSSIPPQTLEVTGGLGLKNPPETFNTLIYFKSPQTVHKPHGFKKEYLILGVYIDRPAEFEKLVRQSLEQ